MKEERFLVTGVLIVRGALAQGKKRVAFGASTAVWDDPAMVATYEATKATCRNS